MNTQFKSDRTESPASDFRPPTSGLPTSVFLTDSPAVVVLKEEFYRLDLREEVLKVSRALSVDAREELTRVRARKAEIAAEIFAPGGAHPGGGR